MEKILIHNKEEFETVIKNLKKDAPLTFLKEKSPKKYPCLLIHAFVYADPDFGTFYNILFVYKKDFKPKNSQQK